MSLFAELKRRQIVRVAILYVAAAWVVLEVSSVVLPIMNAPMWVSRLLLTVLVLGFPVALVLAWVFDVTPQGIRIEPGTPQGILAIALSAVLMVVSTAGLYFLIRPAPGNLPLGRVAVLPCDNWTGDPQFEYFTDGIADDIISRLSRIERISVVARHSAFSFKNKDADIATIGDALNVSKVLECSVRKAQDRIRVRVRLVDVQSNLAIWSDDFGRNMGDIFDVLDHIAMRVAKSVVTNLVGADEARLLEHRTDSVEALKAYMRGRHHLDQWTVASLQQAEAAFNQALEADPGFALAYVGLAEAYLGQEQMEQIPKHEAVARQLETVNKALTLDDSVGEAYAILGTLLDDDGRWAEGEQALRRALELQPGTAYNHILMASHLWLTSREQQAQPHARRARDLDPLASWPWAIYGVSYYYLGQYEKALTVMAEGLELDPHYWVLHWMRGFCFMQMGDYFAGVDAFQLAADNLDDPTEVIAYLASSLAYAGQQEKARTILDQLEKQSESRWVPPTFFAMIHCSLGNAEVCLDYLELAAGPEKDWRLAWSVQPNRWWWAADVDDHPRFAAIREKIGL